MSPTHRSRDDVYPEPHYRKTFPETFSETPDPPPAGRPRGMKTPYRVGSGLPVWPETEHAPTFTYFFAFSLCKESPARERDLTALCHLPAVRQSGSRSGPGDFYITRKAKKDVNVRASSVSLPNVTPRNQQRYGRPQGAPSMYQSPEYTTAIT